MNTVTAATARSKSSGRVMSLASTTRPDRGRLTQDRQKTRPSAQTDTAVNTAAGATARRDHLPPPAEPRPDTSAARQPESRPPPSPAIGRGAPFPRQPSKVTVNDAAASTSFTSLD